MFKSSKRLKHRKVWRGIVAIWNHFAITQHLYYVGKNSPQDNLLNTIQVNVCVIIKFLFLCLYLFYLLVFFQGRSYAIM
ncbi:hypothetical protein J3Q64DRAFT_1238405 [Phycomyces blakesleeanus]|uniref:Uncharacterized protein n=1 Tax=Phycomyces blakesleeanus TaxID=4837 RepID=A0ABR3BAG1_PHYBL